MAFLAFKAMPLIVQRGEFHQIKFDETLSWLIELESSFTILIFTILYFLLVKLFFRDFSVVSLVLGGVFFGLLYSFFEYPIGYFKDSMQQFDWLWLVIPYIFTILIMIGIEKILPFFTNN